MKLLKAIWGTKEGYVFAPRRKLPDVVWEEGEAYAYPEDFDKVIAHIKKSHKDGYDIYWCPLVFTEPKRLKECVHETSNLLWADLDEVDPRELEELKPSIAWASSDDRYQGLWFLDDEYHIDDIETVNKGLSYKIGADKGGWDVTQVLRVPKSNNHKYDPPQKGRMLWAEKIKFKFSMMKEVTKDAVDDASFEDLETLYSMYPKIHVRIRDLLETSPDEVEVGERSERLWEVETGLIEAGVPLMDVLDLVKACAWNKFRGRKTEDEQLWKEVLKAEAHVRKKGDVSFEWKGEEPEAKAKAKEERTERMKKSFAQPYAEFLQKDIDPPAWLVEGIWQQGTYGMIAGEPKTYKSVQAGDLALSVASGKPYLGNFPVIKQGNVLYVQEENNESTMQDRWIKLAHSKGLTQSTPFGLSLPADLPLYLSNNAGIDLTSEESRKLMEETIKSIKPILIVLDPLYMMLGQTDENSAKEVGEILRWLTYIRNEYGSAILVCHHYNKGGSSSRGGQRVRGSGAFHAWVESSLYVKATSTPNKVEVEREFRAFPTTEKLSIAIEMGEPGDPYYRPILDTTSGSKAAIKSLKHEEVISTLAAIPRSKKELRDILKMSRRDVDDAIDELLSKGDIERFGAGGRAGAFKYGLKGRVYIDEV